MTFKINAFERFIIRNHTLLKWLILVVGVASYTLFLEKTGVDFLWILLTGLLIFVPIVYLVELTAILKFRKIQKMETDLLDMKSAVEASDKMLGVFRDSQLSYIGSAVLLKANALYNMGEKNETLATVYDFIGKANCKRPPYAQLAENQNLLASAALYDYDFEKFEEHLRLIEEYTSKCNGSYRRFFKKADFVRSHRLNERLYKSQEYDSVLEKAILDKTKLHAGRTLPEDKVSPLSLVVAYSLLCEYFRRLKLDDKRREYSEKLVKLANEQFKAYRDAKEFLENANEDN